MKIGILQCDNVRSSLVAEFGEYSDMFIASLKDLDDRLEFLVYRTNEGELPTEIDECDAYIITGSRFSVFDDEVWIKRLLHFVISLNKSKKKAIGICFGHQMIAEALNGKVERAESGWQVGVHTARFIKTPECISPDIKEFNIVMSCEDGISELPDEARVVASSNICENMILEYGEHFLTIQGHPEFSKKFAKSLLPLIKESMPSKRYEGGISSFAEKELDNEMLFEYIESFLKKGIDYNEEEESE